ncbi:MAG: response regulator transcription factor [Burkholderiales bacterium]|nr:response regulator transcription factor [Burkholderiales bacterium]
MSEPCVYVVDDDAAVRDALQRLLESAGHGVRAFESAAQCLQFLRAAEGPARDEIACLVLDLAMPGQDGLQLQQRLLERAPELPVVFLTGRGDIAATVQAMKRGATDFLTKPVEDEVLLAAVDAALAEAGRRNEQRLRTATIAERLATLTARERQVLDRVLEGRLNKQIAGDLGTTEKTVKFHRGNAMRKMGVRSVAELARRMVEAGAADAAPGTKAR